MAGDVCGPSILLPAIASGFGLNEARETGGTIFRTPIETRR